MPRRLSTSLMALLVGMVLTGCASTTGPLPGGSPASAAKPQSADSILASLPVFRGAIPSMATVPQAMGIPLSSYLEVASATYTAPASGDTIEGWYEKTLGKTGWRQNANSSSSTHGRVTVYGMSLTKDARSLVTVNLSFIPSNGSVTTYMVTVNDIAIPARPVASLVPRSAVRVVVRARTSSTAAWRTRVVSTPSLVRQWVAPVDSVTLFPSGTAPFNCALDLGQTATLTFENGKGSSWTFKVDPACASMTAPDGSVLSAGSVWQRVKKLFGLTAGAAVKM